MSDRPTPEPETIQPLFPNLEVLGVLGRGGMGVVYRARQTKLDRLVALKILAPELSSDPSFEERFTREARALAKLNHPNIVSVHDFGEIDGTYYLVMEFVEGAALRDLLRDGAFTAEQALALVPQICEGLHYAHEQGVVHRDVKPENILIDPGGRAKIADFGLAKLVGQQTKSWTLTGVDQVMGTPHYMAPEQMQRPQEVDHRADIYSLGVVFYEMLTRELPVGSYPPPSVKAKTDARFDRVVRKAMEREPAQRYQQVSEVRSEVEDIGGGAGSVPAAPASGDPTAWADELPWSRLDLALASWLASVVVAIALWSQGEHDTLLMAAAYPLAFLPLALLQAAPMLAERPERRGAIAMSVATCVFLTASLGTYFFREGRVPWLELVVGGLLLGAHWMVHRWVASGVGQALLAATPLYLLGAALHGGRFVGVHWSPFNEGLACLVGFAGLHFGASAVVLLPGYFGSGSRPSAAALLRGVVPGAVAATIYFTMF
ncbi:MAG: serine/threonine-protein kinase [Planctomycetota bacterium]